MRISGVYRILNTVTGKSYVGSSNHIARRWREHRTCLYRDIHPNLKLQRSWNKYGREAWEFSVVEKCQVSVLLEREQFYIDEFNSYRKGYNQSPRADRPTFSISTRRKIGAKMKGRVFSAATIKRMQRAQRKRFKETPISEMTKRRMSRTKKRTMVFTTEHRRRISEGQARRWARQRP